jgi:hypothetical protein
MDIEVRVVDVNIPAESRPHIGKHSRMVDQADDFGAVRDRAEQVHRAVRVEGARLGRVDVHAVDRFAGGCGLIGTERAPDDQVAVAIEGGALLSRHRNGRRGVPRYS